MIIYWPPPAGGSSTSTNPGAENVRLGVDYVINGEDFTGEFTGTEFVLGEATLTGTSLNGTLTGADDD